MSKPARISYVLMAVLLVLIGWLHLATLVLTTLFGYFALRQFSFGRSKLLGMTLYVVAVASIGYGLFYFSRLAYKTLPEMAERTIPAVVGFAEKNRIELPFTDYASARTVALTEVKEKLTNVGRYARAAFVELAMLIIGLVVAAGMFLNARWDVEGDPHAVKDSLYSTVVAAGPGASKSPPPAMRVGTTRSTGGGTCSRSGPPGVPRTLRFSCRTWTMSVSSNRPVTVNSSM